MDQRFSIITVCKGRLDHLKESLPRMVAQAGAEVIVVDYACPAGAGDFVEANFPAVRVVRAAGDQGFSNWRARNRGAEAASTGMLVFCDADTLLTDGATKAITDTVPERSFGFFTRNSTAQFNRKGLRLGFNQLRGFQVVPVAAFRRLGGYDEVLEGYAAGGDTDLEERLAWIGIKGIKLGSGIIEDVIEHDNQARLTFHASTIKDSYAAGLLYRRVKLALFKLRRGRGPTLDERRELYATATNAAERIRRGEKVTTMQLTFENQAIGMPRQLGFEEGSCSVSLVVKIAGKGDVAVPPQ